MFHFSDFKITRQFAFLLCLFAAVPLLCLSVFLFYQWRSVNRQLRADLIYLTYLNKNRVVDITEGYVGSFNQLLHSDLFVENFDDDFLTGFSILDAGEAVVFSTLTETESRDFSYLDKMFDESEESQLIIFNAGTETVSAVLVAPILLESGLSGFLVAELNLRLLLNLKENFEALSETGELQLVYREMDGSARILFPPRFKVNANRLVFLPEQTDSLYLKSLNKGQIFEAVTDDYREEKVMALTRHLSEFDWGLVAKIDRGEAVSALVILAKSFGLVFFFLLAFGMVLIYYFYFFVTRPLAFLALNAEEVRSGRLKSFEPLKSQNELGLLSRSLSEMAKSLITANTRLESKVRARTAELRAKYREIQAEQAKDSAMLVSIGEGIVATDADGTICLANETAVKIFGWRDDVRGRLVIKAIELFDENKNRIPEQQCPILETLHKGTRVSRAEYLSSRSDGSFFPMAFTSTPILMEQRIVGAVVIIRDITKEKEIDRMKSEFISIASHQLRGPLASIKWHGELLNKEKTIKGGKPRQYVERINISVKQLIALVDDFLNVSRIESGRVASQPVSVDPLELINNIVDTYRQQIEEKKLKVNVKNASRVKAIIVDLEAIREIYANLVANAVKYSKDGGDILIRLFDDDVDLILEVQDTGEGIADEDKSKVFEKFFRAGNILKAGYKGTGLGLYTAQMLAERSCGKIWFESKLGRGSKFSVKLPINSLRRE